MGSMKVHQLSRGISSWDSSNNNNSKISHHDSHQTSLSLSCKRLRPLAPKLSPSSPPSPNSSAAAFDLKTFIRAENRRPRNITVSDDHNNRDPPQVETHPGGTRWNPTQEQIGILEMLYRGGMRTPNAQQIEQITDQLGKYGKIEGKNVFYWFQNHKARERQKQKRNSLGINCQSPKPVLTPPASLSLDNIRREQVVVEKELEDSPYKRTCRSWGFENLEIERKTSHYCSNHKNNNNNNNRLINNVITLELFPLHPELGRS